MNDEVNLDDVYILITNGARNYIIYENSSNNVIKAFKSSRTAKKFRTALTKGKGFNGWTPRYLLKKTDQIV